MAWSIFGPGGGPAAAVQWAEQLLTQGGYPVTPGNIQFVYDWELSEGGGGRYNPLNQGPVPGHPELTTTGQQYGGGAADFASVEAGIAGALDYLNFSNYSGVKAGLMAGNPTAARSALIASPWAASHYGGGRNFATAPTPGAGTKDLLGPLTSSATSSAVGAPTQATLTSAPGGFFGGLKTYLLDAVLVIFGLVAVIVGLMVLAHSTGQLERTQPQQAPASRTERSERVFAAAKAAEAG